MFKMFKKVKKTIDFIYSVFVFILLLPIRLFSLIVIFFLFSLLGFKSQAVIHNGEEVIGKNRFDMPYVYAKYREVLEENENYKLKAYRNHRSEPYTICYGFTYIYHRYSDGKVNTIGTYLKDTIVTPQYCEEQLKLVFDYNSQQLYKAFTLEYQGKKTNRYNQMTDNQLVGMLDLIHHNGRKGIKPVVEKMRIYLKNPTYANQIEVQKAILFKTKQGSEKTRKGFNNRRDRIIKLMFG